MKNINILVLSVCALCMTSCAVVENFCTQIFDSRPLDNNGSTYHVYSQQEAIDRVMNTREAQAWNSSTASRGLLLASTGINLIENFTGHDLSEVRGIIDATTDDLVANKNTSKSDKHALVGAAFYGAGHIAGYFEDQQKNESNASFFEAHSEEDNFDCRYQIDEKTGYYVDIQKHYGLDSVMRCIRRQQQEEYLETLRKAVSECAPFEDFDTLIEKTSDLDEANRRSRVLSAALKCYNANHPEDESPNENIVPSNSFENSLGNSSASERKLSSNEELTIRGSNVQETNIEAKSDEEILETIKTEEYRFNSYALSDANKVKLDSAAEILLRNPELEIELLGHSCDIGNKQAKYFIGIQRAKAAKEYLVEKGVDAKHIYVHSYSDKRPLVPNDSKENRAKNRRVEIKIIK